MDENGTFLRTENITEALKVRFALSGGLNRIEVVSRGTLLCANDDELPIDCVAHAWAFLRAAGEFQGRIRQRIWSINPTDGSILPIWEGDPTYVLQVVVSNPNRRILLVRDYSALVKHYTQLKYSRAMFVFEPLAL